MSNECLKILHILQLTGQWLHAKCGEMTLPPGTCGLREEYGKTDFLVQMELCNHCWQKSEDVITCSVTTQKRGISSSFAPLTGDSLQEVILADRSHREHKAVAKEGADGSRHRFQSEVGELSYLPCLDPSRISEVGEATEYRLLNSFQPFRIGYCSKARRQLKMSHSNSLNVFEIFQSSRRKISFPSPIKFASQAFLPLIKTK